MHLAAGLLREDAEQQRLGQAGLLVRRPHQVAHVLVVLVGVDQVRTHPGEPVLQRRLDRSVDLDDLRQLVAVQHVLRARGLGHVVGKARALALERRLQAHEPLGAIRQHRLAQREQVAVGRHETLRLAAPGREAAIAARLQVGHGLAHLLATRLVVAAAQFVQAFAIARQRAFHGRVELIGRAGLPVLGGLLSRLPRAGGKNHGGQ